MRTPRPGHHLFCFTLKCPIPTVNGRYCTCANKGHPWIVAAPKNIGENRRVLLKFVQLLIVKMHKNWQNVPLCKTFLNGSHVLYWRLYSFILLGQSDTFIWKTKNCQQIPRDMSYVIWVLLIWTKLAQLTFFPQ